MISYLITDPQYYTNDIDKFKLNLQKSIDTNSIDMICFRDKISSNFILLATEFVSISKQNNIQNIFLNSEIKLAFQLKATGVHLTSMQFGNIKEAQELGLKVIISCHTIDEIEKAIDEKVDFITYSPIFSSPNKGKPKGLELLKDIVLKYDIKIIALGGIISQDQIEQIKLTNCYGFASIRYFTNIG